MNTISNIAVMAPQSTAIQRTMASLDFATSFSSLDNLQGSASGQASLPSLEPSPDSSWAIDFNALDTLNIQNTIVDHRRITSPSSSNIHTSDILPDNISSLAPWMLQSSNSSLFTPRAFTKPSQAALAPLAMRILRSYPFMISRQGILPPFVSPNAYSRAELGNGIPQKVSCLRPSHSTTGEALSLWSSNEWPVVLDMALWGLEFC